MTDLRTAAQQALKALEQDNPAGRAATITALKAALAEPQIDPVDEYRKGFIAGQIDMRDREREPVWEPVAWAGCGECDSSFPCHDGKGRCRRLPAQQSDPVQGSET